MATELNRRLADMAERGEWRGADANMASARAELAPGVVRLSPELRSRPGWIFALGAAVLVMVLIGSVGLLRTLSDGESDVAGEVPAPTLAPGTEPSVAPPVTEPVPAPTSAAPAAPPAPTEPPAPPASTEPPLPPQAMNWSRISLGVEGEVWTVIAGGPGFIAGGEANGDGALWTSTDGVTWDRVAHDDDLVGAGAISDLVAGDNGYVAVGGDGGGAIWFSPDGVSWERVPNSPVFATEWLSFDSVAYGPSGYIAMGADADPEGVFRDPLGSGQIDWTGAVWASPDGLTWERIATDALPHSRMHDVIAAEPGYVAVGFYWTGNDLNVGIWVSEDGRAWSHHVNEPSYSDWGEIQGVAAAGGQIVATGYLDSDTDHCPDDDYRVAIWVSDGTSWSRVGREGESVCGGPGHGVAQSGDEIVIVGARGRWGSSGPFIGTAWVSRDAGVTWHRTDMPEDVFGRTSGNTALWDTVGFRDGYVAVGTYGNEATVWIGTWNEEYGS